MLRMSRNLLEKNRGYNDMCNIMYCHLTNRLQATQDHDAALFDCKQVAWLHGCTEDRIA